MKKLTLLLILSTSFTCIAQATDTREYSINFWLLSKDMKNISINFIYNGGRVEFRECNMFTKTVGDNTNVTLTGKYNYIVGPPGFLPTICIQKKHLVNYRQEEIQSYFIHFDSEIGSRENIFRENIGQVELDRSKPFMNVEEIGGTLKIYEEISPQGWEEVFLSQINDMIQVSK